MRREEGQLPWLTPLSMAVTVLLLCSPLLWVSIPPLVDVPGHTAAAGIEAAAPNGPPRTFYSWHWALNLNAGGEVLMSFSARDCAPAGGRR